MPGNYTTLWREVHTLAELPEVAARVATELRRHKPFCLWLSAPLGAGKTTFSGALLRALGLPEGEPVTSPTYTYMNEYHIGELWYAHLDLYRSRGAVSPEELGLTDVRPLSGILLEWPEQAPEHPTLQPTHRLEISFTGAELQREWCLQVVEGL